MITILAFVFVLGVNVFVHELGHFLAAKRVGIRVLKFQLGFNPTVISYTYGGTEYGVGALPLGGFVKMAGENLEDVERDEHGKIIRQDDQFLSKSRWQRFFVLIMGPTMNLLLAVVVMAMVLYRGADVPVYIDQPPVVGVVTDGSPAAQSDIRPGDQILSVAGHGVDTWEQFSIAVGSRPNRETAIELLRNGRVLTRDVNLTTVADNRFDIGFIGVLPNVHPHVPSLSPGDPAEKAGVQVGDVILAVDGHPVTFSGQLPELIEKKPNEPITLTVLRNGVKHTIPMTTTAHGQKGWIGIGIQDETKSIRPGAFQAIGMSVQKNVEFAGLIFQTVWGLLTRETSPKQLMGPVAIAQLSGESAALGLIPLLSLLASISLNLGLLNLLPIPILDGGHIFIMGLEGIARRDFSVRVKEKLLLAGFVVLMMLMVTVIYNDLARISWIGRLIPWK